ncbi:Uncharacterised protein [Budvicia aquatica]|uniref:Uncharacterized protein n=1 Tax=Budvicia aquatica TaxID=82979 RepID=A0A484ZEY2_9GAMM|nr:Uncharacterised protein [Budvicia aquatica]
MNLKFKANFVTDLSLPLTMVDNFSVIMVLLYQTLGL